MEGVRLPSRNDYICSMEIRDLYNIFVEHPSVTTDSRDCTPNSIFFALKGANFNGNAYAAAALQEGCAYAVVDEPQFAPADDPRFILVDDTLRTFQQLARYHRHQLGTTIVGITGTNGKTTTKELTAAVLRKKYNVLFTEGNYNNSIGVPKTLLRLTAQHEVAVVEMGASHPGDIKELVEIARPDYGLITNVGKAHLEGFGSFEGVIRTKGELYDFLRQNDRKAFINNDNPYLLGIAHGLSLIRYGQHKAMEPLFAEGHMLECNPFLTVEWQGQTVRTHLIGAYNIDNVLAAATIGKYFSVSDSDICAALEEYKPSNNRSQFMQTAHNQLIVDAYNANPTSMRLAIENFQQMNASSKMVILGDMGELGEASQQEHESIVRLLAEAQFDVVWLVGRNFQNVRPCPETFRHFDDVEQVKTAIAAEQPQDCTILIKGSNATKLFQLPTLL